MTIGYTTGFEIDLLAPQYAPLAERVRAAIADFFPAHAHDDYVACHFKRYVCTLELLQAHVGDTASVLDVGSSMPYVFQAGLADLLPSARHVVVEEKLWGGQPYRRFVGGRSGRSLAVSLLSYDIERAAWPFADGTFDLVLCTEVLEHLAVNPLHVFLEAHRCLRPGGLFCVTTPNIACFDSYHAVLHGSAPHCFGYYHPLYGVHGHHNREFVLPEVLSLGRCAAFDTVVAKTCDVYGTSRDLSETIAELQRRGKAEDRGQIILYLGRRSERTPEGYPGELFLSDPRGVAACV